MFGGKEGSITRNELKKVNLLHLSFMTLNIIQELWLVSIHQNRNVFFSYKRSIKDLFLMDYIDHFLNKIESPEFIQISMEKNLL